MVRKCVYLALAAVACFGQSTDFTHFEVATIKPVDQSVQMGFSGGPGSSDPGRVTYGRIGVRNLISEAYGVRLGLISGPSWLDSQYAVTAKIPPGATRDQYQQMMANLLVERFGLVFHRVPKELSGYDLVVAPGGPKFSAVPPETPPNSTGRTFEAHQQDGVIHMALHQSPLGLLADRLRSAFDGNNNAVLTTPVINKTGLSGNFELKLDVPMVASLDPPIEAHINGETVLLQRDNRIDPKTASAALEKQLGLTLRPMKQTVDLIVVDHLERTPTAN